MAGFILNTLQTFDINVANGVVVLGLRKGFNPAQGLTSICLSVSRHLMTYLSDTDHSLRYERPADMAVSTARAGRLGCLTGVLRCGFAKVAKPAVSRRPSFPTERTKPASRSALAKPAASFAGKVRICGRNPNPQFETLQGANMILRPQGFQKRGENWAIKWSIMGKPGSTTGGK